MRAILYAAAIINGFRLSLFANRVAAKPPRESIGTKRRTDYTIEERACFSRL